MMQTRGRVALTQTWGRDRSYTRPVLLLTSGGPGSWWHIAPIAQKDLCFLHLSCLALSDFVTSTSDYLTPSLECNSLQANQDVVHHLLTSSAYIYWDKICLNFTFSVSRTLLVYRVEIVKWVVENRQPFMIVEDPQFILLIKIGHPGYCLLLAATVARDVKHVFIEMCQRISKALKVILMYLFFVYPSHYPHLQKVNYVLNIVMDA